MTYYRTIALAEAAITAKGYQRDKQRHIWFNEARRTAKVMRDENNSEFYIESVDFA